MYTDECGCLNANVRVRGAGHLATSTSVSGGTRKFQLGTNVRCRSPRTFLMKRRMYVDQSAVSGKSYVDGLD